jgi:hypothetical protein
MVAWSYSCAIAWPRRPPPGPPGERACALISALISALCLSRHPPTPRWCIKVHTLQYYALLFILCILCTVHPLHFIAIHFRKATRVHNLQRCALCAPCALQSHIFFEFLDGASKCTLYKMCCTLCTWCLYFEKCTRVHTLQICAFCPPCALCALLSIFKAQVYVHIIYSVHFFLYFLPLCFEDRAPLHSLDCNIGITGSFIHSIVSLWLCVCVLAVLLACPIKHELSWNWLLQLFTEKCTLGAQSAPGSSPVRWCSPSSCMFIVWRSQLSMAACRRCSMSVWSCCEPHLH